MHTRTRRRPKRESVPRNLCGKLQRRRVHGADDRLPTGMNMNMLDSDFLLALAAIPLESLDLHRERPEQLDREIA